MRVVNAVARADAIMGLVASTARPLSIGSIARDLGLPRNTTYELVFTLCECRLLRMGVDGRVSPGIRLFELGGVYVASLDWVEEAREVAREVRDLSGETVQVAMLDGRDAIYLVKEESQKAIRMASSIGRRLPAHASAIGKVLLAGLPLAERVELLGTHPLERLTEHTIVDPAQLMEELESTERRGYALDNEESSPEVCCVAAPIWDSTSCVIAAMSVSMPTSRLTAARREEHATLLVDATTRLSARLGHVAGAGNAFDSR